MDVLQKHFPEVLGIVILLLSLVFLFRYWGGNIPPPHEHIKKIVTVEGFPASESNDGLCKQHASSPHIIHDQCQTFSEKNCNAASCCVQINGSGGRCVGGNADGPFYLSENDAPIKIHSYSHLNTCYGDSCASTK